MAHYANKTQLHFHGSLGIGNFKFDIISSTSDNVDALKIVPNPASSVLRLEGLHGKAYVQIFNSEGIIVLDEFVTNEIDITNLKTGLYILTFPHSRNIDLSYSFIKM